MAIDTSDEILQDFLVEAGELLERLGEQLVELEQRPQDKELLNAVFRNFHTVKGGAGFLSLDALVEICHRAEDVFNILRQGERVIDAPLMDVVLRAHDIVNAMVDGVRNGVEPEPADRAVIEQLRLYAVPGGAPVTAVPLAPVGAAPAAPPTPKVEAPATTAAKQFDAMVDAAAKTAATPAASGELVGGGENITDAEFERLLDQLHGGAAPAAAAPTPAASDAAVGGGEDISDAEFEQLLDTLQSKKADAKSASAVPAKPAAPVQAKPAAPVHAAAPAAVSAPASAAPVAAKAAVAEKKPAAEKAEGDDAKGSKDAAQSETTVRVDTKRLDDIMNLVGELVLVRNRLATLRASMSDEVAKAVGNLDLVTADLQNSVMKTRMQPIKKVFGRFPRVVRDLARSLNKQVQLELYGEETDLDKNLVEALADPLVHLVRNSVDHGVEDPETRRKNGKEPTGTVKLSAEQEGDHILLAIEDDGAGIDPETLRRKVVEKGLLDADAAARLDDHGCFNLIFLPGFSTKDQISDISGRGVGMDVVKTRITQLNGTIEIDSKVGKGTRISIKVPLTLAIMPTLMVQLEKQIFALPLANVIEIFDQDTAKTRTVDGKQVVVVRDKALPLVYLRNWLVRQSRSAEKEKGYVVVVSYGSQHVGCVVDQLIGQEEVVIKPLGTMLQGTKGLAGATITGNGRIALILDMPGLMESYARRM